MGVVPLTSAALESCVGGGLPSSIATRSVATNITNIDTRSHGGGAVYAGIKSKVEAIRDTNAALQLENAQLRQKLDQQREKEAGRVKKVQSMAQSEMDKLRSEYDAINRRQSQAIEQLLHDKEDATSLLDRTKRELHALQATQDQTIKSLQTQHDAAAAELKGKWAAQEKRLREQWTLKEEKRIKDATLRAMEPDIALLVNRHKAEKARLHEEHLEAIKRKDEEIANKEAALNTIKAKVMRDAEELIIRERDNYRERLKEETDRVTRQMEEDRKSQQQKRDALEHFYMEQKQSMQAEMRQLESELFAMRSQLAESTSKFHSSVTAEASKISDSASRQLEQLKQQLRVEHDAAVEKLKKNNKSFLDERESELRRSAAAERDAAIAKVIQQLENEHIAALGSLKDNDRLTREKYLKQDRELERLRVELDLTLEQLRTALVQIKAKEEDMSKLQASFERQKETIEQIGSVKEREFDARLQRLDAEWQQKLRRFETMHVDEVEKVLHDLTLARRELEREQEKYEAEMRSLEQKHNAELSSINDKVLVTVAKRDGAIRALQEQVAQLEAALRDREHDLQQTRQLLHS